MLPKFESYRSEFYSESEMLEFEFGGFSDGKIQRCCGEVEKNSMLVIILNLHSCKNQKNKQQQNRIPWWFSG